jgi:hypothetical protein
LLWIGPWAARLSGGEGSAPFALRLRFGQAGWRSPLALQIYFISKTLLALLLPTLAWGVMETQAGATPSTWRMALVIAAAALGYYLPDVLLHWRIQRRQLALSHAFPDALDLLRLCVQAGLGLDAAIDRVGLASRAHHFPSQLSGGQQQRVAIARAIVGNPRILLADEPTGNLDSQMGEEIMGMLHGLQKDSGTTIVMVTHDPRLAEQTQRTVRLFDGRQVQ